MSVLVSIYTWELVQNYHNSCALCCERSICNDWIWRWWNRCDWVSQHWGRGIWIGGNNDLKSSSMESYTVVLTFEACIVMYLYGRGDVDVVFKDVEFHTGHYILLLFRITICSYRQSIIINFPHLVGQLKISVSPRYGSDRLPPSIKDGTQLELYHGLTHSSIGLYARS